jgi:methyl-accepting chemotaxis protein
MAIADKKVPIYISSRASGYIDDEGNVTIDTIYTYDIVYRPGFKNAKLKRITESKRNYSKNIAIYEWCEPRKESINENNNPENMEKYVTKEDFDAFQKNISDNFEAIKKALGGEKNNLNETKVEQGKNFGGPKNLNESNDYKAAYDNVNKQLKIVTESFEDLRKSIKDEKATNAKLVEHLNKVVDHQNEIAKTVNEMVDRDGLVKKDMKKLFEHMNLTTKFVNKIADSNDMIVTRVNELNDHSDLTTKFVNKMADHSDLMTKFVNKLTDSNDMIVTRVNEVHDHSDMSTKFINKLIGMQNAIAQQLNTISKNGTSISQHTTSIIESAKNRRTVADVKEIEKKYGFVKNLDESTRRQFSVLPDIKQKRIAQLITENRGMTALEMDDLIAGRSGESDVIDLLSYMPKSAEKVWEGMSRSEKYQIISLSRMRNLRTPDEIELFWESLELSGRKRTVTSMSAEGSLSDVEILGYDIDDVKI